MGTKHTTRRQIILPKPLPHQTSILLNDARFKVVVCGRRWGKTASGLQMAIRGHGQHRGQRIGAHDGGNIWWVAPSFPVSQDIWRDLKRAGNGSWADKDEVERRIEFIGGGAITVKSADRPDSLRGAGLDGLIVDETATVKHAAWRESLRPALSDKKGWAVFFGTPKGYNWFRDLWHEAPGRSNWTAWQRPSSDNPLMDPEELTEALRDIGSFAFQQEYLAQFVTDGAGLIKREWLTQFVTAIPRMTRLVRYWDKSSSEVGDYSVGALLGVDANRRLFVIDVVRGRWSPFERDKVIEQTAELDVRKYGKAVELWLEQEPGGPAKQLKIIHARQWAHLAPRFDRVTDPKHVRLSRTFAPQAEAGNVFIMRGAWNREWIDELVQITPNQSDYEHDDQGDATGGASNQLLMRGPDRPVSLPTGHRVKV